MDPALARNTQLGFKTALELLKEEEWNGPIPTMAHSLDVALGGGINMAQISEFVGQAGIGKTQFWYKGEKRLSFVSEDWVGPSPARQINVCMCGDMFLGSFQLCVNVQLPAECGGRDGKAVYVDSEGSFNTQRMTQIAQGTLSEALLLLEDSDVRLREVTGASFLNWIYCLRCHDHIELTSAIFQLTSLIKQNPEIKLIIVDSIASNFRQEFENPGQRNIALVNIMQELCRIAMDNNVAVVLTNQVTTKFRGSESGYTAAALGETYSHLCTTRVFLSWDERDGRVARVLKSSHSPDSSTYYSVRAHFFAEYKMEGISDDAHEIYMEVMPDEFLRILKSSLRARSLKLKLTKKGNPLSPHLTFEVRLPCPTGSRFISHDVPVHVVPRKNWGEYTEPPQPPSQVIIELPQVKTIQKVVHGMKSMSKNYVILSANNDGELHIRIETDSVTVRAYFSGLTNCPVQDPDETLSKDAGRKEMYSVRLDIRTLSSFLTSQQLTFCQMTLGIVHNRVAHFKIDIDEVNLQYFIPGITL